VQRERIWQAGVAIALAGLVAYSFYQRWQVLAASPFPLGVDGYFYPIQVRALLETGSLQYPSSPLTFWLMAPLAAATDPITGAKLGAALGGALVALPAYAVGARFGRNPPRQQSEGSGLRAGARGAGMIAAAVAASSATSAYLTIEFVKQSIGLTIGLAALWLLLRALDHPTRLRKALAVAGFAAALLTHKLAAVALIAIAIPAVIEEARGRAVLRGRRLLYTLVAVVVLVMVLLVLALAFPFLLPGDPALLAGMLSTHAEWTAPALATPRLVLDFDHEARLARIGAIGAAVARQPRPG
jgi:hypothetical protein